MPRISNYALAYAGADFNQIASSGVDLMILEGRAMEADTGALTYAEVQALVAQGRWVASYVDVSVTDHTRPCWNAGWTTNGDDAGTLTGSAPSWLVNSELIEFDPAHAGPDGRVVDYRASAWRQIVVNQAVDMVTKGYNAVFLDDVGRYYGKAPAGATQEMWAREMIMLVEAVRSAVKAVNPDAIIVINGDPYHGFNADQVSSSGLWQARFLASFDVMLLENPEAGTLDFAEDYILPNRPVIVLRSFGPDDTADLWERGFIPYRSADYDYMDPYVGPQTEGADIIAGGDGPNIIEGLGGNDQLSGLNGADKLYGGAGNDTLDGGAGADKMYGGTGDDTYHVGTAADQVIEAANAGTDTVMTALAAYTLGANIENGTMKGTGHNSMTGNALNNVLRGNAGNNILDGGTGGADDFYGGAGNDTYYLNSTTDRVFELAGQGYDVVYVNNNFSIGTQEIEEVILTGTLARNLTGGAGANTLRGNSANNVLNGGGGADVLTGGGGADRFTFSAAGDTAYNAYDWITDLQAADIIDLSGIDANTTVAGDQAFVKVSAFTGVAGQVRLVYSSASGDTYVQGDTNGDGVGDFRIRLTGDHRAWDNFVL